MKKIVCVTGTRADFGKLKYILIRLEKNKLFDLEIFVTGMHLLKTYDYTFHEIEKAGFSKVYKFINQNNNDSMDHILSKTISGFSDYIKENRPDLVIVHGDRLESLGTAIVGCFNNILVAHIEGGEVSGTVDEMIRHSITKVSHLHFVTNEESKKRIIQLGELESSIHKIGSPEVDILQSSSLPSIKEVKTRYGIMFEKYSILVFHPVTSEHNELNFQIKTLIDVLLKNNSNNYIVIHPNNDLGTNIILNEYKRLEGNKRFKMFPSMRFEYFIQLMKNSEFVIGNSSSGVRETPVIGIPSINIGTRQNRRNNASTIINSDYSKKSLIKAFELIKNVGREVSSKFGFGGCSEKFENILMNKDIWKTNTQKYFVDLKH
tara:strand:+ start:21771 stop:22898 length:1128 start_codon:yes stop_codon:yes gene_type:complete